MVSYCHIEEHCRKEELLQGEIDTMRNIGRALIEKPLALYYCLKDPETPGWPKLLVFGALAYFVSPIDFIPDLLVLGIGSVDDILLVVITLRMVSRYVRPKHVEQARRLLETKSGKRQEEQSREEKNGPHDSRRRRAHTRNEDYYAEILGLNGDMSPSHIKSRYSDLAKQYHPDRVQHLGGEFREMAERKMKEINEAYEYFKNKR